VHVAPPSQCLRHKIPAAAAAQIAASPEASYVSTEDVPKEFVDSETALEMQKEDIMSKPEQIRCAPAPSVFTNVHIQKLDRDPVEVSILGNAGDSVLEQRSRIPCSVSAAALLCWPSRKCSVLRSMLQHRLQQCSCVVHSRCSARVWPNRQACLEASDVETSLAPKLYTT